MQCQLKFPEPVLQYLAKMVYWASYENEDPDFRKYGFQILKEIKRQCAIEPRVVEQEELTAAFSKLGEIKDPEIVEKVVSDVDKR